MLFIYIYFIYTLSLKRHDVGCWICARKKKATKKKRIWIFAFCCNIIQKTIHFRFDISYTKCNLVNHFANIKYNRVGNIHYYLLTPKWLFVILESKFALEVDSFFSYLMNNAKLVKKTFSILAKQEKTLMCFTLTLFVYFIGEGWIEKKGGSIIYVIYVILTIYGFITTVWLSL